MTERATVREEWRQILAILFVCAGLITLIATVSYVFATVALPGGRARLLLLNVPVFFFVVAAQLYVRFKAVNQPDADEIMAKDARPPVVYLRSFDTDDNLAGHPPVWTTNTAAVQSLPRATEEMKLVQCLRVVGPVVAVARHGERVPRLGASRLVCPEEDWRGIVVDLVRKAKIVVVRPGTSPGIRWEMQMVISHGAPERTLFFIPLPVPRERSDVYAWAAEIEQVRRDSDLHLPKQLPPIAFAEVIRFLSDWTPLWVAVYPQSNRLLRLLTFGGYGARPDLELSIITALKASGLNVSAPSHRLVDWLAAVLGLLTWFLLIAFVALVIFAIVIESKH